ncbi:MAG: hypothetical protein LJE75_00850 [Gammaproteobacteria bacterium]|nr:hypothetical protein [Gammaproteobacteria bacterium]
MNRPAVKPRCIALGTMVAMTLANVSVCDATENPFTVKPIASGKLMLAEGKGAEA